MIGWITLCIALAISLAILASVLMRIDDWGRDWTQNRATLDPDAQRPELRPVTLDGSVQDAADRIRRWTETDSSWDWVSASAGGDDGDDERQRRVKLTRTTGLMRFVDDIEVEVSANPDGRANPESQSVIVRATSQSRVGKGDLGQNPRNLIELTSALRDE